MKHIGFTGTRKGMTPDQYVSVARIIATRPSREWSAHHGDCVGADFDFHKIAASVGAWTVGHVPMDDTLRAFCDFHELRIPSPYMQRNAAIVAESDVMIACPAESDERITGGTWRTIRMARQACRPLAIVWPNGTVKYERWT